MNGKIERGKSDYITSLGVVFLVTTLIVGISITTNPNLQQLFGSIAATSYSTPAAPPATVPPNGGTYCQSGCSITDIYLKSQATAGGLGYKYITGDVAGFYLAPNGKYYPVAQSAGGPTTAQLNSLGTAVAQQNATAGGNGGGAASPAPLFVATTNAQCGSGFIAEGDICRDPLTGKIFSYTDLVLYNVAIGNYSSSLSNAQQTQINNLCAASLGKTCSSTDRQTFAIDQLKIAAANYAASSATSNIDPIVATLPTQAGSVNYSKAVGGDTNALAILKATNSTLYAQAVTQIESLTKLTAPTDASCGGGMIAEGTVCRNPRTGQIIDYNYIAYYNLLSSTILDPSTSTALTSIRKICLNTQGSTCTTTQDVLNFSLLQLAKQTQDPSLFRQAGDTNYIKAIQGDKTALASLQYISAIATSGSPESQLYAQAQTAIAKAKATNSPAPTAGSTTKPFPSSPPTTPPKVTPAPTPFDLIQFMNQIFGPPSPSTSPKPLVTNPPVTSKPVITAPPVAKPQGTPTNSFVDFVNSKIISPAKQLIGSTNQQTFTTVEKQQDGPFITTTTTIDRIPITNEVTNATSVESTAKTVSTFTQSADGSLVRHDRTITTNSQTGVNTVTTASVLVKSANPPIKNSDNVVTNAINNYVVTQENLNAVYGTGLTAQRLLNTDNITSSLNLAVVVTGGALAFLTNPALTVTAIQLPSQITAATNWWNITTTQFNNFVTSIFSPGSTPKPSGATGTSKPLNITTPKPPVLTNNQGPVVIATAPPTAPPTPNDYSIPPAGLSTLTDKNCQKGWCGDMMWNLYQWYKNQPDGWWNKQTNGNFTPADFLAMMLVAETSDSVNVGNADAINAVQNAVKDQLWGEGNPTTQQLYNGQDKYCTTPDCAAGIMNFLANYVQSARKRYNDYCNVFTNTCDAQLSTKNHNQLITDNQQYVDQLANLNPPVTLNNIATYTVYNPQSPAYGGSNPTDWGAFVWKTVVASEPSFGNKKCQIVYYGNGTYVFTKEQQLYWNGSDPKKLAPTGRMDKNGNCI